MRAKSYNQYLDILPEIKDALEKGLPIVALESTIYLMECLIHVM